MYASKQRRTRVKSSPIQIALQIKKRERNDLPEEIKNANSIAAFKNNLKRLSNISSSHCSIHLEIVLARFIIHG